MTSTTSSQRRVLLLETDERAGLVASIANACAEQKISLEIATGPGHVLITFAADEPHVEAVRKALLALPGVSGVHPYTVETG
jgi:hypothetical protein